jgi:hypothetical protein
MPNELAVVTAYDSATESYVVMTKGASGISGGKLLRNIPRKVTDPTVVSPLAKGDEVVMNNDLGFPYIDGVLMLKESKTRNESVGLADMSITGDAADTKTETEVRKAGYFKKPGVPADLMEHEYYVYTPDGNFMGIMRGKYNVISAGQDSKAKIEIFGERDLTRISTENFELDTSFGKLAVHNYDGRSNISLYGGIDQLSETGKDEENWTFKLDIGELGDFFSLETCRPDGHTLSKINITPQGRLKIMAHDGVELSSCGKNPSHLTLAGDYIQRIMGKVAEHIEQSVEKNVEGTQTVTVSESDNLTVGGGRREYVGGGFNGNTGGDVYKVTNGGSFIAAKPNNKAYIHHVLNGSYVVEAGNLALGSNPAARAGINMFVNNGAVTLGANPSPTTGPAMRALVNLNTSLPNSIALGGTTNTAIMHATMYEPLFRLLQTLCQLFDAHVHPPLTSPPSSLMSPVLLPMSQLARSKRVLIGG